MKNNNNLTKTRKNALYLPKPSGTTPPLPIFQPLPLLNQLAKRVRNFLPGQAPSTYTSMSGTLEGTFPEKSTEVQGVNPLHRKETPTFEIIFVRHGQSCANAILDAEGLLEKARGIVAHKQYLDPELTTKGKELSIKKYNNLKDAFTTDAFKKGYYTIGSSPLLRAQETAYYMLAKHVSKPVNVMPYLGETGKIKIGNIGLDNEPMDKELQDTYLNEKTKGEGYPFQRGMDKREPPDFQRFWYWAETEGIRDGWFTMGPDKVYRAVIFSHSNTLQEEFPFRKGRCVNLDAIEKPLPEKLANNDFLVTLYNPVAGKNYLHPELQHKQWFYYDTRPVTLSPQTACGINSRCSRATVRVTSPCAASGGKRKTRRSQHSPKGSLRLRRRSTRRRLEK